MSQTSVIEEALVRLLATRPGVSAPTREAEAAAILADVDRRLTEEQRVLLLGGHEDLYDEAGLPT